MPTAITYLFEPRSITYRRTGQFWAVPLSDSRFGCGRVLHVPVLPIQSPALLSEYQDVSRRLMDWSGDEPPTAQAIAGYKLLEQGRTHVAAIADGQQELG